VDLARLNSMEAAEEVDVDTHFLETVSKEEFGTKADAFRDSNNAHDEDDEEEERGARQQTCHMQ
jgi:hypothetical protein